MIGQAIAAGLALFQVGLAVTLHYLAWKQKIARDEPNVVLHLSIAALLFAGLGSLTTLLLVH